MLCLCIWRLNNVLAAVYLVQNLVELLLEAARPLKNKHTQKRRPRSSLLFGTVLECRTSLLAARMIWIKVFGPNIHFGSVVVWCCVTQMIIHLSAASILPNVRSSFHPFLQIILALNLYSVAWNWMNSVPQTETTTFAFSSRRYLSFFYSMSKTLHIFFWLTCIGERSWHQGQFNSECQSSSNTKYHFLNNLTKFRVSDKSSSNTKYHFLNNLTKFYVYRVERIVFQEDRE